MVTISLIAALFAVNITAITDSIAGSTAPPTTISAPPALLKTGDTVPNFTVDGVKGAPSISLSSLRGKVVVLDFWATWCGPCRASFPHLESIWTKLKDRNDATVLALCTTDERENFDKWVLENKPNYSFPYGYDPAGRDNSKKISRNLFGVTGIPTTFIIGKDGKVVDAVVGYQKGDHRIEIALRKAGVDIADAGPFEKNNDSASPDKPTQPALALSQPKYDVSKLAVDLAAFSDTYKGKLGLKSIPVSIPLVESRPSRALVEPKYDSQPRYGTIRLGNGPNAQITVVLADNKLYVDANNNGNLTDDEATVWDGTSTYRTVRASYGTNELETSSSQYSVNIYGSSDKIFIQRNAARTGDVVIGGKSYKSVLVEADSDGLFTSGTSSPVYIVLDLKGLGKIDFASRAFDISKGIEIDDKVYRIVVSPDGSTVKSYLTDEAPAPKLPPAPRLLDVGDKVPDSVFQTADGVPIRLSSFSGKVLVLDFWATWCGPCIASFPHLEAVWQKIKGRPDATILAANVYDEKSKFDSWQATTKYTFPVSVDPAGRDSAKSIARNQFGVTLIPVTFVIGKDGRVASRIVGNNGSDDHRLEDALKALGID